MSEVTVNTSKKTMTLRLLKVKKLTLYGLLAVSVLLLPIIASAQNSVTFSVSPTIFDMTGTPGQTWRSTVRVINVNPFELRLYVTPANFEPKGEEGVPKFRPLTGDPTEENTLGKWIDLESEVIIGAEQTLEIPFTITLPTDATPGGHYAALMISTKPSEGDAATQVKTSQVISSLIFLRVTGDVSENSSIRSFRTSDYISGRPETTFELRIENKGNVHVQPQGEIKIFNMWGQERGIIPVNQKTLLGNVLPQSVRKFSFDWKSDWSLTDIGRYTAITTLAYGVDTRQFMTADTAFWVIPWKFLLLVFGTIGGFIALMTWAIKLYVRRVLALAGVAPALTMQPPVEPEKPATKTAQTIKGTKRKAQKMAAEIVAPIEVGILDLRSRLDRTKDLKAGVLVFITFVRTYWKFFIAVVALGLFIWAVVWFVSGALTPARDFEVTVEENGQSVTVTSDDLKKNEASLGTSTEIAALDGVPITLVNRSGFDTALGATAQALEREGYTIEDKSTEVGDPQPRTVIVYDREQETIALKLSQLLDNALLSAFTEHTSDGKAIIIYIGADAENVE